MKTFDFRNGQASVRKNAIALLVSTKPDSRKPFRPALHELRSMLLQLITESTRLGFRDNPCPDRNLNDRRERVDIFGLKDRFYVLFGFRSQQLVEFTLIDDSGAWCKPTLVGCNAK